MQTNVHKALRRQRLVLLRYEGIEVCAENGNGPLPGQKYVVIILSRIEIACATTWGLTGQQAESKTLPSGKDFCLTFRWQRKALAVRLLHVR